MTLLVAILILSGPLWALTGAWIYHRGTTGSSPLAAPFVRKITVAGDDEPTAKPSEYQRL